jgi:hypothetical protein
VRWWVACAMEWTSVVVRTFSAMRGVMDGYGHGSFSLRNRFLNPETEVTPSTLKNPLRFARCAWVFVDATFGLVNPHSTAASCMSARVMASATEGPCPESSKSMAMLYGGGA